MSDSEKVIATSVYKDFTIELVESRWMPSDEDVNEGYYEPVEQVSRRLEIKNKYGTKIASYSSKMAHRIKTYIDNGKFSHEPVHQNDIDIEKLKKVFGDAKIS